MYRAEALRMACDSYAVNNSEILSQMQQHEEDPEEE
jgi:hypothetical protein